MALELSPENPVYVRLNRLQPFKSPKLCLSIASSDEKSSEEQTRNDVKYRPVDGITRLDCDSCHVLRRLVTIKDIAIHRLTEDREDLKIRLTRVHNKNIELKQRLKRLENESQRSALKTDHKSDKCSELSAKYAELEAINRHLRQHLNTLREVFNQFHHRSDGTVQNDTTTTTTTTSRSANSLTQSTLKTMANESQLSRRSDSISDASSDPLIVASNDSNNNNNNINNNLIIDESLGQNSKSDFENWYNK